MIKRSPTSIVKAVIFALTLREMRGRLNARRLGAFWVLFEPIAHVLALVALFTIVRGRNIPGFEVPVFLLVGIVPFLMMKNVCLKLMEAVASNKALFSYRQIKPFDAIVARSLVEISLSACVYVILMAGIGFFGGFYVGVAHPMEWLGVLVVALVLSFSIGMILCVVGEAVPELKTFFRLMFLPLYFISGVVYPVWIMPHNILSWILWNPFLHIIDSLRWAVFSEYPQTPGINMAYPSAIALIFLFVAMGVYRARRLALVAV